MSLKIQVAKSIGFCTGVKKAIEKANKAASKYPIVYMLGDIVHNEKVIRELEKTGVRIVDVIDNIENSSPVLFRAHGTPIKIWKIAEEKGLKIIDATCPLVLRIHKLARILEEEDREIIIIGDHHHEEVEAIASQVHHPFIVSNIEEAKKLPKIKRAGTVVQSTQLTEDVSKIISIISTKVENLRFENTICMPTRKRQEQVKELARSNDVMIIVGSFKSANTKRLTEMAKRINPETYQVQGLDDINPRWFTSASTVGISAGASTPEYLVNEVVKKISDLQ
jgi:4-hydroxy-3-methylbut-2-enyl diphosphate reductase